METKELLKKVRKIEIKTRGLSQQVFSGEYHSAFKGRGMAFSEVREYIPGDDIRAIDWNVTARFNHPFIKVFEEERELTVMLLVDMSASGNFGTHKQIKKDLITEICAVISFSALQNNDKIGALFFTDTIEKFIPPKKGKSHILRIISEMITTTPKGKGTDVGNALKYLTNALKKRSIAFLLSDFLQKPDYEDAMKICNRKHDLVALHIHDRRESELPDIGLTRMNDPETGETRWINTSSPYVRRKFNAVFREHHHYLQNMFRRSGVDQCRIATGEPYIKPLMNLFKQRGTR
ncbi:MAG: DUF58 domain-containing protein [Bacteroidota bacterium]